MPYETKEQYTARVRAERKRDIEALLNERPDLSDEVLAALRKESLEVVALALRMMPPAKIDVQVGLARPTRGVKYDGTRLSTGIVSQAEARARLKLLRGGDDE